MTRDNIEQKMKKLELRKYQIKSIIFIRVHHTSEILPDWLAFALGGGRALSLVDFG
jgi:hypothetical protein